MGEDLELGCRCGQLHGWARGVSRKQANRAVCYCDDCQAFLHHLGRAELLDEHGGTDIVQVPPNVVSFDRGLEKIVAVRLSEKGMHRWYTSCCKTPLGNTLDSSVPFIGMQLEVFRGAADVRRIDEVFGAPGSYVMSKFAIGSVPQASKSFPLVATLRIVVKVLGWKFTGKTWPHPYFDPTTRAPKYPVAVLPSQEREALRSKCGPSPSV